MTRMLCGSRLRPANQMESNVASGGIDGLSHAGSRTIAAAIIWCTQERPAFNHLAWDAYVWGLWVIAAVAVTFRDGPAATGLGGGMTRRIPVDRPFPDITNHVEQTVAIGRELPDWCGPLITVRRQVLPGKLALPSVGHMLAARSEFLAPGVGRAIQPSARGKLPLSLGRQFFANPLCIGFSILVGDMDHRMLRAAFDRTLAAFRMPPVRTWNIRPPIKVIAQIHTVCRLAEDYRSRLEHVGFCPRVVLGSRRTLRQSHILGGVNKPCKLLVSYRVLVNPKAFHPYGMHWPLFRIMAIRPHAECAATDPHHVGVRDVQHGIYILSTFDCLHWRFPNTARRLLTACSQLRRFSVHCARRPTTSRLPPAWFLLHCH